MIHNYLDRQLATNLHRKWYFIKQKDPLIKYDAEQIQDLHDFLMDELNPILNNLYDQGLSYYRAEIPILFIGSQNIYTFTNEILVADNIIQSLNMPGCIAIGKNIIDAFSNYFYALIECADARYRNGMDFMNIIQFIDINILGSKEIEREQLIKRLNALGWTICYEGIHNTVLLKQGSKVSYTIPRISIIPSMIDFWIRRMQFLKNANI